jgi:hypothetical protein
MVTCPSRIPRLVLISLLLWTVGAVGAFAQDFRDPFGSDTASSNGPLGLSLTVDKGCGSDYKDGDPITIWFRTNQSATLNMVNVKPNGQSTQPVTNLMANGGWTYRIDSSVGMPLGQRTLKLYARAGDVTDYVECSFSVSGSGPAPIIVHLSTDRGCGEQAVYQRMDPLTITWSVEEDARVRLVVQRPTGELVIRDGFDAKANQVYSEVGNAGSVTGPRVIQLSAESGDRKGYLECSFNVVDSLPQRPIIAVFQTNRGCGSGAAFKDGEPISFLIQLNETARVTLTNTRPNGSSVILDNELIYANQLVHIDRVVGQPTGTRTLTLVVYTATRTETQQCTYEVINRQRDNSISIALSTNRGSSDGATFKTSESIQINFTLSTHAFVQVRIVGPFNTQQLLSNYEVDGNHPVHLTLGVGEPVGMRTIVVDAVSEEHGGHAELSFNVVH